MTITTGIRQYAAVALLVILGAGATHGQWLVPPTSANQVAVTVTPTVTFDAASGLYTYAYSLTSRPTSVQNVVGFALQ